MKTTKTSMGHRSDVVAKNAFFAAVAEKRTISWTEVASKGTKKQTE
jgi:hypothetical protein